MSDYNEYEEHPHRSRRDRDRDYSPDFYSGGGPQRGSDPDVDKSSSRRENMTLQPPSSASRPRSQPPPNTAVMRRPPSRGYSRGSADSDDDDSYQVRGRSASGDRGRSDASAAMDKARGLIQDNFTHTSAGIGAGLLGAVVGGLVAREASNAANRHRSSKGGYQRSNSDETTRMVSTVLGAVAGGIGANVLAHKVEEGRHRKREKGQEFDQRRDRSPDPPAYESGRHSRHSRHSRTPDGGGGDDDDYDYVYDDRPSSKRRSNGNY